MTISEKFKYTGQVNFNAGSTVLSFKNTDRVRVDVWINLTERGTDTLSIFLPKRVVVVMGRESDVCELFRLPLSKYRNG